MLKGVNRQVVEINRPESRYFERILFVVKPEFSSLPSSKLLKDAQSAALETHGAPPRTKPRRTKTAIYRIANAVGAAVIILLVILLFLK